MTQVVGKKMAKDQQNYRKDFHKRVRATKETSEPRNSVFVRTEFYNSHIQKHKLAPATDGRFRVLPTTSITVAIQIDKKLER